MLPRFLEVLENGRLQGLHIGAQLYVSHRGQVVCDAAWGLAEAGRPMLPETPMVWLSASKPLTALALAQCVDDWDLPIAEVVPEFAAHGKQHTTLRHLLTHTAGLRSADSLWNAHSWQENLAAPCSAAFDSGWELGKRAGYHLSCTWFVLAEVLQRLTAKPIEQVVRERLFQPLGLHQSLMATDAETYAAMRPHIGIMHNTAQGRCEPHSFWDTELGYTRCRPGSSTHGPIRELGQLYECLLFRNGDPLLAPNKLAPLITRQRTGMFDHTFQHTIDWGLGFILNSARYGRETVPYGYGRYASEETFGHSGAQSSAAFADPKHELVVAWVLNGMCGEALHRPRARALNNAVYEELGLVFTA